MGYPLPNTARFSRRSGRASTGRASSDGRSSGTRSGGSSIGGDAPSSSQSRSPASGKAFSLSGSQNGHGPSAAIYSRGGGPTTTIPEGAPFVGRTVGGGTREEVFGTQTYGSGYPGYYGNRGVSGLDFPFVFYPVVWDNPWNYGPPYLYDSREYGDTKNTTRPGGPMSQVAFHDKNSNNTLHLLGDNSTVTVLIPVVASSCNPSNSTVLIATPLASLNGSLPRPEQAVQYFRASSLVLTLDGYNNSATLAAKGDAPDVPLPAWVDRSFLGCLNQTIGAAVPLVSAARRSSRLGLFSIIRAVFLLCVLLASLT